MRALLAALVAAAVNVLLVLVATRLDVASELEPLSVGPVALFSFVGVLGVVVVYWLLKRFVSRPDTRVVQVAAVVLMLSFVPNVRLYVTEPTATAAGRPRWR